MNLSESHISAVSLLKQIISIPSISRQEAHVADFLQSWMRKKGFEVHRKHNNLWVLSEVSADLPWLLLNSHCDTVKPSEGWTRDPFLPEEHEGRIYGLGSSDAGGSLVTLISCFELLAQTERRYNLALLISAEEEISGAKGISSVLRELPGIDLALVGEPTNLKMSQCERGLIVMDCKARGRAGHVAHKSGINAIYIAMEDIRKIRDLRFDKKSDLLGDVEVEVTMVQGGSQHNVIPDTCSFVIDVRTQERYSNEEIVDIIRGQLNSEVNPRSLRLNPSSISPDHPLVLKARSLGIELFGSLTMSDQALISSPSVKIGPGLSELSHKADEHIEKDEIYKAINLLYNLLKDFSFSGNPQNTIKDHETLG